MMKPLAILRYNNRKVEDGDRFAKVLGQTTGKRLTYKSLIGDESTVYRAASEGNDGASDDYVN